MFFLKRLHVQFDHYMKSNLWYIIINEGTCVFEHCIYFRKEHIWCSHVKSLPGWSLCSTKHHRYGCVTPLAWQLRNPKPVYILHRTHHKWESITGMAPPAKTMDFFYWQSYFNDRIWSAVWENQYLMLPQCGLLGLLIFSVSNWLKYEVLLPQYMSGQVSFFFFFKDQVTFCANFTFSSNQIAWPLSID